MHTHKHNINIDIHVDIHIHINKKVHIHTHTLIYLYKVIPTHTHTHKQIHTPRQNHEVKQIEYRFQNSNSLGMHMWEFLVSLGPAPYVEVSYKGPMEGSNNLTQAFRLLIETEVGEVSKRTF